MKKIFLFAVAVVTAMTVNAQMISFSEADVIAQDEFPKSKVYASGDLSITLTNEADGGKFLVDANKTKFGTSLEDMWESTTRLNIKGKSDSKTAMKITVPAAGKLKIYARTSGKETGVTMTFNQFGEPIESFELVDTQAIVVKDGDKDVNIFPIKEFDVAQGDIQVSFTRAMYFYAVEFVAEGEEGIEELLVAPKANKVVYNGQVVIVKEGRMFNLLGAEIMK